MLILSLVFLCGCDNVMQSTKERFLGPAYKMADVNQEYFLGYSSGTKR